jgi:hypothetical protein
MTGKTASQAFVDAVEANVQQEDLTDTVARLLDNCADVTGAAAVGLLVKDGRGQLEVLSATSHRVAELDLYQLQHDTSPSVDAARDGIALRHGHGLPAPRPTGPADPRQLDRCRGRDHPRRTTASLTQRVCTAPVRRLPSDIRPPFAACGYPTREQV